MYLIQKFQLFLISKNCQESKKGPFIVSHRFHKYRKMVFKL